MKVGSGGQEWDARASPPSGAWALICPRAGDCGSGPRGLGRGAQVSRLLVFGGLCEVMKGGNSGQIDVGSWCPPLRTSA